MPTDTPTDRVALEALADEAADRADTEAMPGGFDARVAATLRALAARVVELEAALRAIASHGNNCGCHQATFINIARAALEPDA